MRVSEGCSFEDTSGALGLGDNGYLLEGLYANAEA